MANNPEVRKRYYQKHAEEIREKGRAYYWSMKDSVSAKRKVYHVNNREALNSKSRRWRERNREKSRKYNREYAAKFRQQHPDKFKSNILKAKYGITLDEYNAIANRQGWVCAICKQPNPVHRRWQRPTRLAVDHHHRSNEIRGLLCHTCNNGLGCFKDDPALVQLALDYLRKNLSSMAPDSSAPIRCRKSASPP